MIIVQGMQLTELIFEIQIILDFGYRFRRDISNRLLRKNVYVDIYIDIIEIISNTIEI